MVERLISEHLIASYALIASYVNIGVNTTNYFSRPKITCKRQNSFLILPPIYTTYSISAKTENATICCLELHHLMIVTHVETN